MADFCDPSLKLSTIGGDGFWVSGHARGGSIGFPFGVMGTDPVLVQDHGQLVCDRLHSALFWRFFRHGVLNKKLDLDEPPEKGFENFMIVTFLVAADLLVFLVESLVQSCKSPGKAMKVIQVVLAGAGDRSGKGIGGSGSKESE